MPSNRAGSERRPFSKLVREMSHLHFLFEIETWSGLKKFWIPSELHCWHATVYRCPDRTMHILIIEDERKLGEEIGEGLRGNGYEVALSHTGESGIKHLYDNPVDLILLDVMLPRVGALVLLCYKCRYFLARNLQNLS